MSGDVHVRLCESLRGRFPRATRLVIGFEQEQDAHRVMDVLPKRFNRFGLSVHPEKTKLVRFGRPSGDGKPERNGTFDFLGFTHFWSKSRRGNWVIKKKTMGKRVSRFVKAIWQWCRHKRHEPLKEQHKALCVKLRGYYQYYAVRHNSRALNDVLYHVKRAWQYWLSKRSHRGIVIWDYFERYLIKKYPLPRPRIIHQI